MSPTSSHTQLWTTLTRTIYVNMPTVPLTIDRPGTGTGGVTASGLSCPGGSTTQALPCGASYALHTARTLTAVPDPGSSFAGWGGACSGTGTCQVTMSMARYVTASFTKLPATIDTRYYHTDPIGSVRAITDETGAVVIRHDYRPFGEDVQPLTGDPMRFAGKELDEETGQQYFDARYYRNTWGRFTTVDPITVSAAMTDPQQWNRYAYTRNNPLKWVDPSGMQVECPPNGGPCTGYTDTSYVVGYSNGAFSANGGISGVGGMECQDLPAGAIPWINEYGDCYGWEQGPIDAPTGPPRPRVSNKPVPSTGTTPAPTPPLGGGGGEGGNKDANGGDTAESPSRACQADAVGNFIVGLIPWIGVAGAFGDFRPTSFLTGETESWWEPNQLLDAASGAFEATGVTAGWTFARGGGQASLDGQTRAARRGVYSASIGARQLRAAKAFARIAYPAAVTLATVDLVQTYRGC